jgi:hypothetical protein
MGSGSFFTRWFVIYTTPASLLVEKGSVPGYVFGVDICMLVRGGDVKRVRSFGSLTKPVSLGDVITQLSADFSSFC